MAKTLENIAAYIECDPATAEARSGFFTYDVVDGKAAARNQVYRLDPKTAFTKIAHASNSVNELWRDSIDAIKVIEGIA